MVEGEQLHLPLENPYSLRLPINDALDLFWDLDWRFTAKARTTKKCFERFKEFCTLHGNRYVDEIGKTCIESYRRWLRQEHGFKENTINTHHMIATRLFNFLNEIKSQQPDYSKIILPEKNPGTEVKKVSEKQFGRNVYWPKKVVNKMIRAALDLGDLGLAEIIEFQYKTALRPSDLWRITDKNVNLARMVISGVQHKNVTRKNPSGVPYLLALTKHTASILRRRMSVHKPGDLLFSKSRMQERWNACRLKAGHPDFWFKDLRPSAATLLLDNNIDPETVKNVLGHTSLRMLPTYAIRGMGHLKKAANKLEDDKSEILT